MRMSDFKASYADVILSIPQKQIDRAFQYRVPDNLQDRIQTGMRALVPFGPGGKQYEATVVGLTDTAQISADKLKSLLDLIGDEPVFTAEMLALTHWMRDKYYTTYADCLKCVQPAGIQLKRKTRRDKTPVAAAPWQAAAAPRLTHEQERALAFILEKIDNIPQTEAPPRPILIHGVTGSGKTEIYLRLIEAALRKGRQAIVLVPEIALTPQTVSVFVSRLGDAVTVTHSRLSQGERYEQWKKARDGQASVMIGPRSAIFAPFPKLGVIIIDEEHEHTYKSESSPKYSAREVAVERGRITGAAVVLGSATPSLTTYYQAESRLIDKVVLRERVNQTPPEVSIVDMRLELARGNRSIFSMNLQKALTENIQAKKQSILFLNRRGHSTFVSCRNCGEVLKCDNCSVNYTYHIASDTLICHYCGKKAPRPDLCPTCGSKYIKFFGVGTQKVEEEALKLFPQETVIRMDLDTTKGKRGHEKLLNAFRRGEASILIGTQMIAKGLDFPNVTLVGVIAADVSLNNGDFRAGETTFQLLTQVAGRAGRAQDPGRVFIQTYSPDHYSVVYAKEQNYEAFYAHEIALRRQMVYPPFSHIFSVLLSGESEKQIIQLLHGLLHILKASGRGGLFEFLGPAPAQIVKINNRYRWKLLIKGEDEDSLKKFMMDCVGQWQTQHEMANVTRQLTMDPSMME